MSSPVIGVTIGDPAGIGPEIVVKAAVRPDVLSVARPVVIGGAGLLARTARALGSAAEVVTHGEPASDRIVVRDVQVEGVDTLRSGEVQAAAGLAAGRYVEAAVEMARGGQVGAIATGPISKEALWAAGYRFPGHTEMLEALTGSPYSLTMFLVRGARIFFLTRHLSLRDAIAKISAGRAVRMLEQMQEQLALFGLERPRLAVAALNPHGGEGGALGSEEREHLQPAVAEAQRRGLDAIGPIPADAVFHQAAEGRYDAVLALYHDQGHIAAKTLDFHGTVSVTLGLPFLRTSVDHGTAFDIAGRGIAREDSMAAAIVAAAVLHRQRYGGPSGGAV